MLLLIITPGFNLGFQGSFQVDAMPILLISMVMTVMTTLKKAGVIGILKTMSITRLKILMASGKLDSNVHNVAAEMVVQLTSTMFTLIQATENPPMETILKATNNLNLFTFYI